MASTINRLPFTCRSPTRKVAPEERNFLAEADYEKSDNANSEFSFKFSYISNSEFQSVFKQVRRARQKKLEEKNWEKYLRKKKAKEDEDAETSKQPTTSDLLKKSVDTPPLVESDTNINKSQAMNRHILPTTSNEAGLEKGKESELDQTIGEPIKVRQDVVKYSSSEGSKMDEKIKKHTVRMTKFDKKYAMKKMEGLQEKIVTSLNDIEEALNKDIYDISQPSIDMLQSKKRNIAFAARFKRNYHYQLDCQIKELSNLVKSDSAKKSNQTVIIKKFLSSHQVVSQALQVVRRHVSTALPVDESFSWLKEFIDSICNLSFLLTNYNGNMDKYDDMKIACDELINGIEDFNDRIAEAKVYEKFFNTASKKIKANAHQIDNLWMYRNRVSCNKKIKPCKNSKFNRNRYQGCEIKS